MERVQLEADGALDIPGRHARQRDLPHDHFPPRQQDRGAQAFRARRFEKARVLGAPLGRGAGGKIFHGETAQHLGPVGAHPHHGNFEILGADLQAYAGAEGQ